ncbi:MAG: TldD/PmbA family protein [bacterium]|nr:TldD/PmbA family protein [bacterium]
MITEKLLHSLIDKAKRKGVTECDVFCRNNNTRSARVRLGEIDTVFSSNEVRLELRLIKDGRVASAFTSDVSPSSLNLLLEKTCARMAFSEKDGAIGLPKIQGYVLGGIASLELYDPLIEELKMEDLIEDARSVEAAAREFDLKITNTEGSDTNAGMATVFYASSRGFFGQYTSSYFSRSISVIAESPGGMYVGDWSDQNCFRASMASPKTIGRIAAKRAIQQLGGRKVSTQRVPVIFAPSASFDILMAIATAVAGNAIWRKTSFLAGRLNEMIASPHVTIRDDARLARKCGSRPFDSEGTPSRSTTVIENGRLASYLLDAYSAQRLSLATTGNAKSSAGISTTNFFLENGKTSPEEIISSVKEGLYVTDLIGFGTNVMTGDFSKGARGLWIKNGKLTHPVHEITIAGNLNEMLKQIEMVGNDMQFIYTFGSPTIKITEMTVAGT